MQIDEIKYKDFYFPPPNAKSSRKRKRVAFETQEEENDNPEESDNESFSARVKKDLFSEDQLPDEHPPSNISKYAQRRASIKAQIEALEQENVGKKEWMYMGEASSRNRPKNSLLAIPEELDFERSMKPVPIVTEEQTRSLEEIIKQRILDDNFDDVLRKLPVSTSLKSRAVDTDPDMQEAGSKPSRGLAEVYEQEHLRRIDPVNNPTPLAASVQKQHAEIDELWKNLAYQLDSLTSWRFVPAPEVGGERVVADIPTIDMEEARPDGAVSSTMLAPQEVYRPEAKKGEKVVGGLPVATVEMSREQKVKVRKREAKKREKKKLPAPEGSKKDVIDTLKKGGVKIIAGGRTKKASGGVGKSNTDV
jgi:U3 small nucleolar RNA-associated protein MPP10